MFVHVRVQKHVGRPRRQHGVCVCVCVRNSTRAVGGGKGRAAYRARHCGAGGDGCCILVVAGLAHAARVSSAAALDGGRVGGRVARNARANGGLPFGG